LFAFVYLRVNPPRIGSSKQQFHESFFGLPPVTEDGSLKGWSISDALGLPHVAPVMAFEVPERTAQAAD
jgi:hypothetical protein